MKKLLLLIIICSPVLAFTQTVLSILPEINGIPTYSQVIVIDSSTTQAELYNRAKIWFVDHYNSAKNVLQMEDKEAGLLAGKGIIPIEFDVKVPSGNDSITVRQYFDIYHTIKVYTKKGKYRFEITDLKGTFNYKSIGNFQQEPMDFPLVNKGYKAAEYAQIQVLQETDNAISQTVESLKKAMQKPITGNANW